MQFGQTFSFGCPTGEFGVVAQTVLTEIVEEFTYFVGTEADDAFETRLPRRRDRCIRNAGNAMDRYAVFVSHIGECAGSPSKRCVPVAIVVDIVPHREYLAVHGTVGERVEFHTATSFVADRHPESKTLVIAVLVGRGPLGDGRIHLGIGIVETCLWFDAGDEEVGIFPCLAIDCDVALSAVPRLYVGVELLRGRPRHVTGSQLLRH